MESTKEEKEWKEGGAEEVKEYRRKSMDPAGILKGQNVFLLSLKSAPPPPTSILSANLAIKDNRGIF
jgi:hypothetical protein